METLSQQISDRLLSFGSDAIKLCVKLSRSPVGRHLGSQLLRSAASAGANYEEACGAQSRADFIHKLQIVYQEVRESSYWLKLVGRSDLLRGESLDALLREAQELGNIIAKSLLTAKQK